MKEEYKTWNVIFFKCVGLTYPYYILQIVKILIVLGMMTMSPKYRWYVIIAYMAVIMFYVTAKQRKERKLETKILERFPKISTYNLRVAVRPFVRTKPFVINLIFQIIFFAVTILVFNIDQAHGPINKDYLAIIFFGCFYLMIFGMEYYATIDIQVDKVIKEAEVFKIEQIGRKQYTRHKVTAEFELLTSSINEDAIGTVVINQDFEFSSKTVAMQSVLEGQNSRFQNLTVESIFITGMAISVLFAIINKTNLDELHSSFYKIVERVRSLDVLNWNDSEFFTLIATLAAICSILYLLALIMRIRVGIVYAQAQADVNNLKFLNEQLEKDMLEEEKAKIIKKRTSTFLDAEKLIKSLNLTFEIISAYRITGLFTFFSIIIIVSFQINVLFGSGLLFFAALSHYLKRLEELIKYINNKYRY